MAGIVKTQRLDYINAKCYQFLTGKVPCALKGARTVWRGNQGRVNVLRYPTLTLPNCGLNKRMHFSEYTNAFKQIESVRIENLYKRQKGICDYCNNIITGTDIKEREVHAHHMKPRSFGGNESYSNLKLLHSDCHRELHTKITRKDMSDLSDKKVRYLMPENIVNILESRVR